MMKSCGLSGVVLLAALTAAGCSGGPEDSPVADSAPTTPPATTVVTLPPPPPPHAVHALQWVDHDVPKTFTRGAPVSVRVTVKNTGDWTWPDPRTALPMDNPSGAYAVRLGYAWLTPDGKTTFGEARTDLTQPVAPGETATLSLAVSPPADAGDYQLQLDLVQELVAWFGANGADKLVLPVQVD